MTRGRTSTDDLSVWLKEEMVILYLAIAFVTGIFVGLALF